MILESLPHLDNVEVVSMSKPHRRRGKENGADLIIKGLRAVTDFDHEMAQAQMKPDHLRGAHLVHPVRERESFIQSKFVRDVAKYVRQPHRPGSLHRWRSGCRPASHERRRRGRLRGVRRVR